MGVTVKSRGKRQCFGGRGFKPLRPNSMGRSSVVEHQALRMISSCIVLTARTTTTRLDNGLNTLGGSECVTLRLPVSLLL